MLECRIDETGRRSTTLVLSVAMFLWMGVDSPGAHAQSLTPPPTPKQVRWLPASIHDLVGPEFRRSLARRLERLLWTRPERREWPRRSNGAPVIETERLDERTHTVQSDETLERIRTMYRTTRRQLRRWNPDLDLASLETGDRLVVWRRREGTRSRSWGAPHWGRLDHGVPLPPGEQYDILFPHRAFGTYYTISETRRVLRAYAHRFPDGPKLLVGDISFRTGGPMSPHKSHRTGRDVDITYPRLDEPPSWEQFYDVPISELDVRKTLFLVRMLIKRGYVQYIFMDYHFQREVVQLASEMGAPESWAETIFEYPEWGSREAIVRHSPGHESHMHVRFRCQPTDHRCTR